MKTETPRSRRRPNPREPRTQAIASRPPARSPAAADYRRSPPAAAEPSEIAEALPPRQKAADQYHVNSLVAQVWLVRLIRYTDARYADRAGTNDCPLQTGYAWRSFSKLFYPLSAIESVRLFENLLRFANFGAHPPARAFFLAYAPLAFEHDVSGEYIGPGVWTPRAGSKDAARRVRRTLKRWCDWLEALAHCEVRERHALEADQDQRALDKAIIFLWPLLKRHNWGHLDLLTVLRSLTHCGDAFPCQSEKQLATYCGTALALHKASFEPPAKNGDPAGQTVARRLFKLLPLFQ
jgi:hypothetical protein